MAELQNANPTIINLSELPTRRRQKGAPQSYNDELTAFTPRAPHWDKHSSDIFGGSGSETESDASYAGDPIDEQEIYGKDAKTFLFRMSCVLKVMPRPKSTVLLLSRTMRFGIVVLPHTVCIALQR